jgi:hypothetical protein
MVGIGLIINGLFVSKKIVEAARRERLSATPDRLGAAPEHHSLQSADTAEFIQPGYSVTEETTKHLSNRGQK